MKANIKIVALIFVLTTSCASLPRQSSYQQTGISFQVFYDQLSPYGQWFDYANYGYVWIPNLRESFAPYSTSGYWVLTQYGWAWASDYNWGWAAFHYGRWGFDNSFGWFWVPDYEWGPAWVNWIQGDGYYGWSPMEPGMRINSYFDRRYDSRRDHWCFVRDRDFGRSNIHNYYVNRSDHERIIRNSNVIDRTYTDNERHSTYVSGPDRESVQRTTGRRINPLPIKENNRPGQSIRNGELQIYRPRIDRNDIRKTTPSRVIKMDDVKRTPRKDIPQRNQDVSPLNRPITQPVKREIPENINVQPDKQRDLNQPIRTPRQVLPDQNKPERQKDVTTPRRQDVTTPRKQDVTTPRRQDVATPRKQDVTTPQRQDVTTPRRQDVTTPRNQNVNPRKETKPVKESRTTDQQENKKKEKSPNSEQEKK